MYDNDFKEFLHAWESFRRFTNSRTCLPNLLNLSMHRMSCFRTSLAPNLFRSLFGFSPNHCPGTLDSSILYLARLDAWIYTSVKLLNHQAREGGETQKDIPRKHFAFVVLKAVLSLIREIRTVVSCNLQEELVRKETDTGRADDSSQEYRGDLRHQ